MFKVINSLDQDRTLPWSKDILIILTIMPPHSDLSGTPISSPTVYFSYDVAQLIAGNYGTDGCWLGYDYSVPATMTPPAAGHLQQYSFQWTNSNHVDRGQGCNSLLTLAANTLPVPPAGQQWSVSLRISLSNPTGTTAAIVPNFYCNQLYQPTDPAPISNTTGNVYTDLKYYFTTTTTDAFFQLIANVTDPTVDCVITFDTAGWWFQATDNTQNNIYWTSVATLVNIPVEP